MSKRICRLVLSCLLAGLGVAAQAEGFGPKWRQLLKLQPAAPAARVPQTCPTTDDGWRLWRDAAIKDLLQLRSPTPGDIARGQFRKYLGLEDVLTTSTTLFKELEACAAAGHKPPKDVENLSRFVATQHNANYLVDATHQFGYGVTDDEYLRRAKAALELPCLLRNASFLENISSPKTYRAAWDMIEAQNAGRQAVPECMPDGTQWKTLIYRSRFLGTPDDADTYGRFFIRVPGTEHDRWIQFGIWLPEQKRRYADPIQNVSVVALAKGPDPAAQGRFDALVDWWRVRKSPGGPLDVEYRLVADPKHETGNCQECHKMMPLSIHPAQVYEFKGRQLAAIKGLAENTTTRQLNEEVRKNWKRAPVFVTGGDQELASPRNYGPAFGPDENLHGPLRSDAFMAACTTRHRLSPVSVARVKDNMNCAECHNGRKRGYGMLNYPQATEKRLSKKLEGKEDVFELAPNLIEAYIRKELMPLDVYTGQPVRLSRRERAALFDCLSQEYWDPGSMSGVFVDWLQNKVPGASAADLAMAAPATLLKSTRAPVRHGLLRSAQAAPAGASSGAADYDRHCLKCHPKVAGNVGDGPSLFGVYQRLLASVPGFEYSKDLGDASLKTTAWDEANLMEFIKDPDAFLQARLGRPAESDMAKRYPDENFRRGIVQYLMTLK